MNKPTPGKWIARCMGSEGYLVWMDGPISKEHRSLNPVASCTAMPFETSKANAALIVAAVNACFKVNPSNPLAVAEALPTLVDAARKALTTLDGLVPTDTPMDSLAVQDIFALRSALAKIEAKS